MLQKIPKLTPMGAVPNRTYRAWGLPIYFLKLHQTAPDL